MRCECLQNSEGQGSVLHARARRRTAPDHLGGADDSILTTTWSLEESWDSLRINLRGRETW